MAVLVVVVVERQIAIFQRAVYQRRDSRLMVDLIKLASQIAFNADKTPVPA